MTVHCTGSTRHKVTLQVLHIFIGEITVDMIIHRNDRTDNVKYPGLWAEISCYIIAVLTGCQQRAENTHFELVCLKLCSEKRVYKIKLVVLIQNKV